MKIISIEDYNYPQKLFKLKNPPEILFYEGNISLLNTFTIAVVGSRKFSFEGKCITENLVNELAIRNITILSGMAIGIDSISHQSCINANGKTIAVLGCGLLESKQKKIYKKILESDGLILSEYFPDTPAYKYNFARRNELVVALSDGVVVTEAKIGSGTLITAKQALLQEKPLFTFPADLNDERHEGNNFILSQGAKCILSYSDILKFYPELNFSENKSSIKPNIPKEYTEIYNQIKSTPISISTLSQKLNIPFSELQSKLTLLELDGYISKLPNGNFKRECTSTNSSFIHK